MPTTRGGILRGSVNDYDELPETGMGRDARFCGSIAHLVQSVGWTLRLISKYFDTK